MKKVIFPVYRWGNWSLETLYNMHKVVHLVIMEPGFESGFLEYKTHAYNYYSAAVTVALFPILLDTSLFQIINSGFPYYCPSWNWPFLPSSVFPCCPYITPCYTASLVLYCIYLIICLRSRNHVIYFYVPCM